jgi:DNA-binding transcriptional MerR regulator
MPGGRKTGLSIIELEHLLSERRSTLQKLTRQRAETAKKLDAIDREIARLGGSDAPRTAGGRVRNGVSLTAAMEAALRGKPPMKVGEILKAVSAGGYHSASANFRGIINQTLIKDKRFHAVERGTYTVK